MILRRLWQIMTLGVLFALFLCTSFNYGQNLVINPGFESGTSGWAPTGNFYVTSSLPNPNSGNGYAYVAASGGGPGNNLSGGIGQNVALPANATQVKISFYLSVSTASTSSANNDLMQVKFGSGVVDTYTADDDGSSPAGGGPITGSGCGSVCNYSKQTKYVNVSTAQGTTFILAFLAVTDGFNPTVFRIDDVEIEVTQSSGGGGGGACATPTNLHENSVGSIAADLDWSSVSGADYDVRYRQSGTSNWTTTSTSSSSKTISGLLPSTTYQWSVRSDCGSGLTSSWASDQSFTTDPGSNGSCAVVTNLHTNSIGSTTADLDWNSVSGADYNVRYRVQGSSTWLTGFAGGSSLNLTGLASATTYQWVVQTICSNGSLSAWTSTQVFTTNSSTSTCLAPASFWTNSLSATSANVSWSGITGATYQVNIRKQTATNWTNLGSFVTTSFSFTNLTPGTAYYVRVRRVCAGSTSNWSTLYSFATNNQAPACPQATATVTVSNCSTGVVQVTLPGGVSAYDFEWCDINKTNCGNIGTFSVLSLPLSSMYPVATYNIRVRSNCNGVTSTWSNWITFTTPACTGGGGGPVACASPASVGGQVQDCVTIKAAWTKVAGANQYQLGFKKGSLGTWQTIGTYTGQTAVVNNLLEQTGYYFRVRANCGTYTNPNWSDWTNSSKVTTTTCSGGGNCPSKVTIVSATASSSDFTITWQNENVFTGGYVIKFKPQNRPSNKTEDLVVSAGSSQVTITSFKGYPLEPGAVYQYEVIGICVNGFATSGKRSVTTLSLSGCTPHGTPTIVRRSQWMAGKVCTNQQYKQCLDGTEWPIKQGDPAIDEGFTGFVAGGHSLVKNNLSYFTLHHSGVGYGGGALPLSTTRSNIYWEDQVFKIFCLHTGYQPGTCRDFFDIGYQYVIDGNGNIYEGRPDQGLDNPLQISSFTRGAHNGNENGRSIGICLLGEFENHDLTANSKAYSGLVEALVYLSERYEFDTSKPLEPAIASLFSNSQTASDYSNIAAGMQGVIGHRHVHGNSTTCPGDGAYDGGFDIDDLIADVASQTCIVNHPANTLYVSVSGSLVSYAQLYIGSEQHGWSLAGFTNEHGVAVLDVPVYLHIEDLDLKICAPGYDTTSVTLTQAILDRGQLAIPMMQPLLAYQGLVNPKAGLLSPATTASDYAVIKPSAIGLEFYEVQYPDGTWHTHDAGWQAEVPLIDGENLIAVRLYGANQIINVFAFVDKLDSEMARNAHTVTFTVADKHDGALVWVHGNVFSQVAAGAYTFYLPAGSDVTVTQPGYQPRVYTNLTGSPKLDIRLEPLEYPSVVSSKLMVQPDGRTQAIDGTTIGLHARANGAMREVAIVSRRLGTRSHQYQLNLLGAEHDFAMDPDYVVRAGFVVPEAVGLASDSVLLFNAYADHAQKYYKNETDWQGDTYFVFDSTSGHVSVSSVFSNHEANHDVVALAKRQAPIAVAADSYALLHNQSVTLNFSDLFADPDKFTDDMPVWVSKADSGLDVRVNNNGVVYIIASDDFTRGQVQFAAKHDGLTTTQTVWFMPNVQQQIILDNLRPNPADDKLFIDYHATNSVYVAFGIYNTLGQQVAAKAQQTSRGRHTAIVDVSHLPTGVYFVYATFDNGQSEVRRLVIN